MHKRPLAPKAGLYQLTEELPMRNVPIAYCRSSETYYYSRDYEISISLSLKPLTTEEMANTNAGLTTYFNFKLFCPL